MKLRVVFTALVTIFLIFISSVTCAVEGDEQVKINGTNLKNTEALTAIEYLQLMQKSYKELNYELLYLLYYSKDLEIFQ